MKINHAILLKFVIIIFSLNMKAQQKFMKENLWIGAETGANIANNSPYNTLSLQVGAVAEYYFAKQWSITGKLKYNTSQANYYHPAVHTVTSGGMGPNLGGMFDTDETFLDYKSENIILPINIQWRFRIFKPLYGSLNAGPFVNFMLNSKYTSSENLNFKNPKVYLGGSTGIGLQVNLKSGNIIYTNYTFYRGANLIKLETFLFEKNISLSNHQISFGYLWKLN